MAIDFNHTIVSARDSKASAKFLAEMLGLPAPRKWGPFQMVTTENGANIDFMNTEGEITAQHYAPTSSEPTTTAAGRTLSTAPSPPDGTPAPDC
jgi:hypothetical protein